MTSARNRISVLRALIAYERPEGSWREQLKALSWDVDQPSVTLDRADVIGILDRYLADQLSATQVQEWADLLECREDVAYSKVYEAALSAAIFRLANPELEGQLSVEVASSLKGALSGDL